MPSTVELRVLLASSGSSVTVAEAEWTHVCTVPVTAAPTLMLSANCLNVTAFRLHFKGARAGDDGCRPASFCETRSLCLCRARALLVVTVALGPCAQATLPVASPWSTLR
jgi:hypothetical protein